MVTFYASYEEILQAQFAVFIRQIPQTRKAQNEFFCRENPTFGHLDWIILAIYRIGVMAMA